MRCLPRRKRQTSPRNPASPPSRSCLPLPRPRRTRRGRMLSELFIRRPVLSTVLAAFILLLGFYGISKLPVRQYPEVEETVVTITTVYTGAQPELIQGFITAPIAAAVATTENINYVTSQSTPSVSVVTVNMKLGSDPDSALT